MAKYDLDHLTQSEIQSNIGPIQDDEALFLYALIRGKRMRRILEVGGLQGYSGNNFLKALRGEGILFTVDLNPVTRLSSDHVVLQKDVASLSAEDVGSLPLDLVFFDCHVYDAQMSMFMNLRAQGVINDRTVVALHDTGLHPRQFVPWAYPLLEGWVHQDVERRMVNDLHRLGYDAFTLNTEMDQHNDEFPMRHGLTIMQRFVPMSV